MNFNDACVILAAIEFTPKNIFITKMEGMIFATRDKEKHAKLHPLIETMRQVIDHDFSDEEGIIRLGEFIKEYK